MGTKITIELSDAETLKIARPYIDKIRELNEQNDKLLDDAKSCADEALRNENESLKFRLSLSYGQFSSEKELKAFNAFSKKHYNVIVSPYDFRTKKNFRTTNMNNTTDNSNFNNDYNTINSSENNYNFNFDNHHNKNFIEKYEEQLEDVKNNMNEKNENIINFNKTQIFSKPKPFLADNYNDYRGNYEKYLKNKKLNFYY